MSMASVETGSYIKCDDYEGMAMDEPLSPQAKHVASANDLPMMGQDGHSGDVHTPQPTPEETAAPEPPRPWPLEVILQKKSLGNFKFSELTPEELATYQRWRNRDQF
eukprot:6457323-Amphidinium_carterae.1